MFVTPITLRAHAKLNLSLEVLGKRPDGYHDLVSVLQPISLADDITLSPSQELHLICSNPDLLTDDNLVIRAAHLVRDGYRIDQGCRIELEKNIPVAAGLGGGSSDGAGVLVALTRVWGADVKCAELLTLAAQLGSDVPYFLYGGTCLISGRGERVSLLPSPPTIWYLLVNPGLPVSTPSVFRALSPEEWTDGTVTRTIAEGIRRGCDLTIGRNALQEALFRLHPEAKLCYEMVSSLAPGRTLVSGSGPTVFATFSSCSQAEEARDCIHEKYWTAVAHSCTIDGWLTPCA